MLPSLCMCVCLSQINIYHIISTTWKIAHVHIHTQRKRQRATHLPALELASCFCVVILHWLWSCSCGLLWPMKNHWETNLFWRVFLHGASGILWIPLCKEVQSSLPGGIRGAKSGHSNLIPDSSWLTNGLQPHAFAQMWPA